MKHRNILNQLSQATEPNRFLDASIALAIGYSRTSDDAARSSWFDSQGRPVAKVPLYTRFIEEARRLSDALAPGAAVAVAWDDDGSGKASVDGGHYQLGATPAIALCIAALSAKKPRRSRD